MAESMNPDRPRRTDHVRNRTLLLAAAREVFTEQGADAPVGEIARRAGLAKGTFFRHFASKEVLVQALVLDRISKLDEIAREINSSYEPGWETLGLMMERFLDHLANDRSLGEFIDRGAIESTPEIQRARTELWAEIERAVRGAQEKGEVRADVTGTDLPPIVLMIASTTSRRYATHPKLGRRYLRIFLDGIRASNTTDLGAPPLTLGDFEMTTSPADSGLEDGA